MKLESENFQDYLAATDVIDWKEPSLKAKAQALGSGYKSEIDAAKLLFEWVRDEVPHSNDIASDLVTCRASEVLHKGTGVCYAKSHLLAALLRANNIPAGFCYQVLKRDPPFEGMVLHGLNGVYLKSLKKWIRIDARGNTSGCNARFGTEKEQLAFPVNPGAGEFIYDTIFVSPAKVIVEMLNSFESLTEMWPHLPEKLS